MKLTILYSLVFVFGFIPNVYPKNKNKQTILSGKIPETNHRYRTFKKALKLLKKRNAKIIVETGTSRFGRDNCLGDGCSTWIFGE